MDICNLGKCKVLRVTEKAIQVKLLENSGLEDSYWVPKSQLVKGNECEKLGDVGECIATNWWWAKTLASKGKRDGKVRVLPYLPPHGYRRDPITARPKRTPNIKRSTG